MKVLHIVPASPYGGGQRIVAQLAGAQRRDKIDARILTLYHNDIFSDYIESYEVPYYTTGTHSPIDVRAWIRLSILVKKISPDIVHLHMTTFWNIFTLSLPWMKIFPLIYHAHIFSPAQLTIKIHIIKFFLCYRVRAMIGVSNAVTNDIKKYFGHDISIYRTIYNGIKLPHVVIGSNNCADFVNSLNSRPLIGMATRFVHDKGIKEFIDAIPSICQILPKALFILAGDGPLFSWAKEYSASLGLGDTLTFPGFITHISRFWSSLDFALFTSPCEACPLSVIEPQATGTVVAGYLNGSGSDELIISGETGVLVPWGDRDRLAREIAALWANPERYDRMAKAARQRLVEHFSIEKTAQKCIELYQELLANGH